MKILLDECITKKLKLFLKEYNVFTVSQMGWCGIKNGKLLTKAVDANFDLFITIDKNIKFQQQINNYDIIIVVFNSFSSVIEQLKLFIPFFIDDIKTYKKKNLYSISIPKI